MVSFFRSKGHSSAAPSPKKRLMPTTHLSCPLGNSGKTKGCRRQSHQGCASRCSGLSNQRSSGGAKKLRIQDQRLPEKHGCWWHMQGMCFMMFHVFVWCCLRSRMITVWSNPEVTISELTKRWSASPFHGGLDWTNLALPYLATCRWHVQSAGPISWSQQTLPKK